MFDAGDFTARGPDQGTHAPGAERGSEVARAQDAADRQPVPPVPGATCAWTAPPCELPRHPGSRLCWGHGGDERGRDDALERFDLARLSDETLFALDTAQRRLRSAVTARLAHLWLAQHGEIVISSSWRKVYSPAAMQELLHNAGVPCVVVGQTGGVRFVGEEPREESIREWLVEHPEVTAWVALDDLSLLSLGPRLVQTDERDGFTLDHAQRAISVLRGEHADPTAEGA